MKLAIMQPYFFPYIGYFQNIKAVDKYMLYEYVSFIKQAWMSRNRILQRKGDVFYISVPVRSRSSFSLIKDIAIDESKSWRKKTIQSIHLTYKSSQFFDEVFPIIEKILNAPIVNLHEYNANSILTLARYLDISTEIVSNNQGYIELEQELDFYEKGNIEKIPQVQGVVLEKKVARAVAICKLEGADVLVNPIGGVQLYSKDDFLGQGIKLYFLKTKELQYDQFSQVFQPNLSIIDVLMHNGKQGTQKLLDLYDLI